jgi:hypothetical protein
MHRHVLRRRPFWVGLKHKKQKYGTSIHIFEMKSASSWVTLHRTHLRPRVNDKSAKSKTWNIVPHHPL